jgi:integrase
MASVWIRTRVLSGGGKRYRVEYQLGGRESRSRYAGSFKTMREANLRKQWIAGELAAMRAPDLTALRMADATTAAPTVAEAASRWRASRVDVADSTRVLHQVSLDRVLPILGTERVDDLTAQDVADMVATLTGKGYRRETISKSLTCLAQTLDHAGVHPNPARDKLIVKLPREEREELSPPTASHVATVYRTIPPAHRLPLLFLDWSGARVAAIDKLRVSDYDEPRGRVRLRAATTKTRRALWVELHPDLAEALSASLGPREDRDPDARLFADSSSERLRTAIGKACRALGIPMFSPHDLRHRRISLLHLRGTPWARIGEQVGQRNLAVTANTYSHVMLDEGELDYRRLLARSG